MTESYTPPVTSPQLGQGENNAGYRDWCQHQSETAPEKYTIRRSTELLFSVIVPVHQPEDQWLQECIDSVRGQFFADWELILATDCSLASSIKILQDNQKREPRIKLKLETGQPGISATSNRAANLAEGQYLLFLDHDDLLHPYAMSAFAETLQNHPETDLLYSDEDRFDNNKQRLHPGFKPKFSKQKLLSTNYIHHALLIRRSLFEQLRGFRSQYDGSQDYDLLLRAIEKTQYIQHVPDVLYHMRIHPGSLSSGAEAKPLAHQSGRECLNDYFQRQNIAATIEESPIPGLNHIIYPPVTDKSKALLLLLSDQTEQTQKLNNWQTQQIDEIVVCARTDLSIAERCNHFAKQSQADILFFADADLIPETDCIRHLSSFVMLPETGLVTGKLIYADNKLHSCGLIRGIKASAGRWHYSCLSQDAGYGGWMAISHEVSAVPWQLMAVKKDIFIAAGLFDEQYQHHGFEIDLALKLEQQHQNHLYCAKALARYNSPCPMQSETWSQQDFVRLWEQWQHLMQQTDPCFHPEFSHYDESIQLSQHTERTLKGFGVFNGYDTLSYKLLWQCFQN